MTIVKDPVCGMDVEVETTPPALTWEYKGKTYYFCSAGCKATFDRNPAKFAK